MNIKTKYSLGDKVWRIWRGSKTCWKPCQLCAGEGRISLNGITRICPDCYGNRGREEFLPQEWLVEQQLTVGQVRAEITKKKREIAYMAHETGVGTGSIHYEWTLFPTKEEAQANCDKRNAEEKAKDPT